MANPQGHYFVAPDADTAQEQAGGIRTSDGRWLYRNNPMPAPQTYYHPAQPRPIGGLGDIVPSGAIGLAAVGLAAWGVYEWWKSRDESPARKNPRRKSKRYLKGKL